MDWNDLLKPSVLVFLIPIVAIIVAGVVAVTHALIRHRERLAMIEKGIHPDSKPDEVMAEEEALSEADD